MIGHKLNFKNLKGIRHNLTWEEMAGSRSWTMYENYVPYATVILGSANSKKALKLVFCH